MYNKDDIVYILENDQVVRKAKVAGRQDDLYIVQLIGYAVRFICRKAGCLKVLKQQKKTAKRRN